MCFFPFLKVDSEKLLFLLRAARLDLESGRRQVNRSGGSAESNHEMPNDMQWVLTSLAGSGEWLSSGCAWAFHKSLTYL